MKREMVLSRAAGERLVELAIRTVVLKRVYSFVMTMGAPLEVHVRVRIPVLA